MKSSLVILAVFLAGMLAGFFDWLPPFLTRAEPALYALYGLLFLVGMAVGGDATTWHTLRYVHVKIVLVPAAVIVGSLLGVSLVAWVMPGLHLREALAVGSGFGYYSLSSVVIGQIRGETLGVVALLANIMREMTTLMLTPMLVRYGKLAPIAAGGATAMDTTLPIITRFSGSDYAVIAVFSGLVLTIIVPFLVTFVLG
jgi:uncharacterized membrane protein YbjE (DUF340 family)